MRRELASDGDAFRFEPGEPRHHEATRPCRTSILKLSHIHLYTLFQCVPGVFLALDVSLSRTLPLSTILHQSSRLSYLGLTTIQAPSPISPALMIQDGDEAKSTVAVLPNTLVSLILERHLNNASRIYLGLCSTLRRLMSETAHPHIPSGNSDHLQVTISTVRSFRQNSTERRPKQLRKQRKCDIACCGEIA